jgi:hypothetical protein
MSEHNESPHKITDVSHIVDDNANLLPPQNEAAPEPRSDENLPDIQLDQSQAEEEHPLEKLVEGQTLEPAQAEEEEEDPGQPIFK